MTNTYDEIPDGNRSPIFLRNAILQLGNFLTSFITFRETANLFFDLANPQKFFINQKFSRIVILLMERADKILPLFELD